MSIFLIICIVGGPYVLDRKWGYYLMIYWWPFLYILLSWILLFYHKSQKHNLHGLWLKVLVLAISIFDYVTDINIIIISFRSENETVAQYGYIQLGILILGNIFCVIYVNDFYYPGLEQSEKRAARLWTIVGFGRLWHNILSWDRKKNKSMVCLCTQFILNLHTSSQFLRKYTLPKNTHFDN